VLMLRTGETYSSYKEGSGTGVMKKPSFYGYGYR
jgi:hypothetical protein